MKHTRAITAIRGWRPREGRVATQERAAASASEETPIGHVCIGFEGKSSWCPWRANAPKLTMTRAGTTTTRRAARKKKRLLSRVCSVLELGRSTGHRIGSDLSCFNKKSRHPRLFGRVVCDGDYDSIHAGS
jgi:hypothetical protein